MEQESITPDANDNWLNQSDSDFDSLIPVANSGTKRAKNPSQERALFRLYSLGVSTNRDEWVYDFDRAMLAAKVSFFVERYNRALRQGDGITNMAIKWSATLRGHFEASHSIPPNRYSIISSAFRPFVIKQYSSIPELSDRLTSNHLEMFGSSLKDDNRVIAFLNPANPAPFHTLATDRLPDLHFTGDAQCLPLYRYGPDGTRVSNITEWGLRKFRDHYGDESITPEQIFAYTYAVLHDPVYREKYAIDLTREFPRLPFQDDFARWVELGQELLDLHIGFESVKPYELKRVKRVLPRRRTGSQRKTLPSADKDEGIIEWDERTALHDIPAEVWDYRLGNRSAVEWILDQYSEKTPRDPTIREHFNTYRVADYDEKIVDLVERVVTVSLRTNEIVDELAKLSNLVDDE